MWEWIRRIFAGPRPGFVYVMVRYIDGAIKVGESNDPYDRLDAARTFNPEGVDFGGLFQVGNKRLARKVEGGAHSDLKQWNIGAIRSKGGKEWFRRNVNQGARAVKASAKAQGVSIKEVRGVRFRQQVVSGLIHLRNIVYLVATLAMVYLALTWWSASQTGA